MADVIVIEPGLVYLPYKGECYHKFVKSGNNWKCTICNKII